MVQRWNVCTIVFWRVVRYRAGTFLCMRSWPRPSRLSRRAYDVAVSPWTPLPLWPCRAVAVVSWTSWPWPWRPPSLCRRHVVATRRRTLVFAMVYMVSVLSWFAI